MSAETRHRCGVVFESHSIDRIAHKCATLAAKWGGLAMVFCDPAGTVDAIIPGTLDAMRASRDRGWQLVGTYDVNRKNIATGRELIARDIQHHLQERATI